MKKSAVRVYHGRKESRRDRRYSRPMLLVTVSGAGEYRTVNWSLGGMLLAGYDRPSFVGARIRGSVRAPGAPVGASFSAEIVGVDLEKNRLSCRFLELGPEAVDMLGRAIVRAMHGL